MRCLPSRLSALLCVTLVAALTCPSIASADALSRKRAQAARVAKQVESLNTQTEIASENYNLARSRYDKITRKVHAAERRIAKLKKAQRKQQKRLNTRVNSMYRTGPSTFLSVVLAARSFEDLDATARMLESMNEQDAEIVLELRETRAQVQETRRVLVREQGKAKRQKVAMAKNAESVKARLRERQQLLAGLSADIQKLVARRLADQSAFEQARTMKLLLASRDESEGGVTLGGTPPTTRASVALYWAEKQIGKPYVWAADGPDTFDCSGLMLFAYDKAGVSLTHYSGSQINEGKRVSRSNLRPGDLVFFGSPIHHVGMYVGGDAFLEAPYTGANVKITRLSSRGGYAGACRP